MLKDEKLIKIIMEIDKNLLTSITFKVLIGQLQTILKHSKDPNSERLVINKFHEFVKKYEKLETIKDDLEKHFK